MAARSTLEIDLGMLRKAGDGAQWRFLVDAERRRYAGSVTRTVTDTTTAMVRDTTRKRFPWLRRDNGGVRIPRGDTQAAARMSARLRSGLQRRTEANETFDCSAPTQSL